MQSKSNLAALGAALCVLLSTPAHAENKLVSGAVGLGFGTGPTFPGADENDSGLFPVVDLKIGQYVVVNQRGLGLEHRRSLGRGELSYGLGVGYDFTSRSVEDDPRLAGLSDVDAGAMATLFLEYQTGPFSYGLEVMRGLNSDGHEGTRTKLSGGYDIQLSERAGLSVSPYLIWADDNWMDSFFSVSNAQSVASGLAAYDANAGMSQAGLNLTASYALREQVIVFASVDYATLLGDAADSSVSFDDNAASLSAGVMFRF
ncbi:MipA/OmpV family protein [Rhodobacteraceae bacterium R_SAG7]|jgi:outer membrane scaffolding protein for murein synthesis (MipA/OmpV family)|nr:MipA/OmpV family protein [Rhodobacteraceae bacterium R_SAG7]